MKYPELFEEQVPADTRVVYDAGNGWHLTGTVTWACGHRGIARIALRSVDHPLAPVFFEAERHFYCVSAGTASSIGRKATGTPPSAHTISIRSNGSPIRRITMPRPTPFSGSMPTRPCIPHRGNRDSQLWLTRRSILRRLSIARPARTGCSAIDDQDC